MKRNGVDGNQIERRHGGSQGRGKKFREKAMVQPHGGGAERKEREKNKRRRPEKVSDSEHSLAQNESSVQAVNEI